MEATDQILREQGYSGLSLDEVARRAGVGKRTIYRWWGSKGALVAEAFREDATERHQDVDTGRVRDDLIGYFTALFADVARPGKAAALRSMMAEAQADSGFAAEFARFTDERRALVRNMLQRGADRGEIRADAELALAVDTLFGTFWYRLLLGHAPLDTTTAANLVDSVLQAIKAP